MKTLKREEIYANNYVDLEHLRRNIETFIEDYYNAVVCIGRWHTNRRRNSNSNSSPQQLALARR